MRYALTSNLRMFRMEKEAHKSQLEACFLGKVYQRTLSGMKWTPAPGQEVSHCCFQKAIRERATVCSSWLKYSLKILQQTVRETRKVTRWVWQGAKRSWMAKTDVQEPSLVWGQLSLQWQREDTSFRGFSLPFSCRHTSAYLNFFRLFSTGNLLKSSQHQASVL